MHANNRSSRFSFLGRARQLGLAAALAAFVAATPGARAGVDEDVFPPETLKQMNRDILSGKRPTIVALHSYGIFGLRKKPKLDADFVRFRFDPDALTSAQASTLDNWIRSGANRILLQYDDVERYLKLFPDVAALKLNFDGIMPDLEGMLSFDFTLAKHPVNTDCGRLTLSPHFKANFDRRRHVDLISRGRRGLDSKHMPVIGPVRHMPAGTEIIFSDGNGYAVCGSFPHGKGRVFFVQWPRGADSGRWELNFWHWALGLPVPGAAATAVARPAAPAVAARTMDTITLNDGTVLNGTVLNDSFSVQTSVARFSLPRPKIERITFDAASPKADAITLWAGDRLPGTVEKMAIRFRLAASGQEATVDSSSVKEIRFKGPASK